MADPGFEDRDLRLIHALQIDGRAPFSRIAAVLGVSDQTVARRYAALRSTQRVRVVGRTDPTRLGEVSWFVRIRCVPSGARALGEALARRRDTSWVRLTSGGTEIVCMVRAAAGDGGPLLDKLPRTPHVTGVSANCVLHVFYGGRDGAVHALSDDQAARLRPALPAAPQAVTLDADDGRLLAALRADGRTPYARLALDLGLSETTVRRRVADLRDAGVLYFDVDLDYGSLDPMQTMMWLAVPADRLVAVGSALAAHAEVPFVAATTGPTNIYASVLSRDPAALFTYLSTRVAVLPGADRVETAPVIRTLKHL